VLTLNKLAVLIRPDNDAIFKDLLIG